MAAAGRAAPGHFDELRGAAGAQADPGPADRPTPHAPTAAWTRFFGHMGPSGLADLNRRADDLARQVRDNGVTYNVYADTEAGPQRPWSVDLFPLIVTPDSWQRIEAGVLQRVRLLDRIMADVYGPQQLLAGNLLPPALVQGHPGYLRAMHGHTPAGGRHLHIAAFDLARDAQGHWWVVSQRTQAPSGLGYLLENRTLVSRQFPEAFADLGVRRLAASYRALVESLRAQCPVDTARGEEPRLVLLTPGPYNETYFEHAYLARDLGLTLVEGSDLTVRGERLYLKTLQGLEPVHGILKRLDDEFLDPLELRADSQLGVPGLLQAMRAGHVLVANAPGSAFLESPALLGFLPALSEHLLHESLVLPSLATWWCGERAALDAVLPHLQHRVIKSTYAAPGSATVLGQALSEPALQAWTGRLRQDPDDYTVQDYLPLSQMPTWDGQRILPRSLLLRVFAMPDPQGGWRVLPGGLTRVAGATQEIASMQRGGSSADAWVLGDRPLEDTATAPSPAITALLPRHRGVTSRAAEHLFWLGRYTERTENTARLVQAILDLLHDERPATPAVLAWIDAMAGLHALVPPGGPSVMSSPRHFERSLVASLGDPRQAMSVGYNLAALRQAAAAVRERLSLEQWQLVERSEQEFQQGCDRLRAGSQAPAAQALHLLLQVSGRMAAITGAQTDRMSRDDGWRLLSIGRHLERLAFLAGALSHGLSTGAVQSDSGFATLLELFDSAITFQAVYQKRQDLSALLDLVVLDRDNPRSLAWVAHTLRSRLARLGAGLAADLADRIPDPQAWQLADLVGLITAEPRPDADRPQLPDLLARCQEGAWQLSDDLSARFFTHSEEARRSIGA
jgi:uncharacterized circularly permuted ATP-grasp superfamily protein/uncharacterized alpha-E superfamily protein